MLDSPYGSYIYSTFFRLTVGLDYAEKHDFLIHVLTYQREHGHEARDRYVYGLVSRLCRHAGLSWSLIKDLNDHRLRRQQYCDHWIQELVEDNWALWMPEEDIVSAIMGC